MVAGRGRFAALPCQVRLSGAESRRFASFAVVGFKDPGCPAAADPPSLVFILLGGLGSRVWLRQQCRPDYLWSTDCEAMAFLCDQSPGQAPERRKALDLVMAWSVRLFRLRQGCRLSLADYLIRARVRHRFRRLLTGPLRRLRHSVMAVQAARWSRGASGVDSSARLRVGGGGLGPGIRLSCCRSTRR